MQFYIIFYKSTVQCSILHIILLLELQFYNVHANRFTSKHSYYRITLLRSTIGKNLHSTRRIPILQCIQFPHEVHHVKKQPSTRLLLVYKSTHKKTPSSWRIYKYSTGRKLEQSTAQMEQGFYH